MDALAEFLLGDFGKVDDDKKWLEPAATANPWIDAPTKIEWSDEEEDLGRIFRTLEASRQFPQLGIPLSSAEFEKKFEYKIKAVAQPATTIVKTGSEWDAPIAADEGELLAKKFNSTSPHRIEREASGSGWWITWYDAENKPIRGFYEADASAA